jgi:acyl-CoA synthetase (AMP-forming)/AMP-acid ligase II/thioesterase domain-containing protein
MTDSVFTWCRPAVGAAEPDPTANVPELDVASAVFAIAETCPSHTAVRSSTGDLTYQELVDRVVAMAQGLIDACIGPVVAVCTGQSADGVVAMLAIARAGAGHLVVDPAAPTELLLATFERHGIRDVIDTAATRELHDFGPDTRRHRVDITSSTPPRGALASPNVDPAGVVSVSTTSGSTGRPKAVVHSHRNVVANARRVASALRLSPADIVLSTLPFPYVASSTPTFTPLLAGATTIVHDLSTGIHDFVRGAHEHGATIVFLTAGLIANLPVDDVEPSTLVRTVVTGGDRLTIDHLRTVRRLFPNADVLHRYNTSETHWVAGLRIDLSSLPEDGSVPIGWPVPWLDVDVIDATGAVIEGEGEGEIVVRGAHLALGYLGDQQLTADRFSTDGHMQSYRTGDRARRTAGGLLEFIDRVDGFVKVHDVLVDRSRVEAAVAAVEGVGQAAVVDWTNDAGQRRLAAFAVAPSLDGGHLRRALTHVLTRPEVPGIVECVDRLPLNAMGKIDTEALRARARAWRPDFEASRNDDERMIADAFARILDIAEVGRNDDFFALGADSLATVELLEFLRSTLVEDIDVEILFTCPTPALLVARLRDNTGRRRRRRDSHLVTLTSGSADDHAVVIFGGGSGTILDGLGRLARGLDGCACEALVPRGYSPGVRPALTVGGRAKHAARDIAARFGDRPVVLLGFSAGGVVAYETARRLSRKGKRPAHLVLLDAFAVTPAERRRRRMSTQVMRAIRAGTSEGRRDAWQLLRRDLRMYRRSAAAFLPVPKPTRAMVLIRLRALGILSIRRYRMGRYDGSTTLVRSTGDVQHFTAEGEDLGWFSVLDGPRDLWWIPGRHDRLLDPPSVNLIAVLLSREINRRTMPPE